MSTFKNQPFGSRYQTRSIFNIFKNDTRDYPYVIKVPENPRRRNSITEKENNDKISLRHPLPEFDDKHLQAMGKPVASGIRMSHLDNGITVSSEDIPSEVSALALFVKAGTRYEKENELGLSCLLEKLFFYGTKNKESIELFKELEHLGAHVTSTLAKEYIVYSCEIQRSNVDRYMALLGDIATHHSVTNENFEAIKEGLNDYYQNIHQDPDALHSELLSACAYGSQPYGRPLLDLEENYFNRFSQEDYMNFFKRHFAGPNIILSGCAVDHNAFVEMGRKYFSGLPSTSSLDSVSPVYTGGHCYYPIEDIDFARVSITFGDGGFDKDNVVLHVALNAILGGGSSFSAGGPGKGMFSRLYTNVLNRYGWVESCEVSTLASNNSGVVGIFGKCDTNQVGQMMSVMIRELAKLRKGLGDHELHRVRNVLKTTLFYNLESRQTRTDSIASETLYLGQPRSADEWCIEVDNLTSEKIAEYVDKIMKTPPTVVVIAPNQVLEDLPSYDDIAAFVQKSL